MYNVHLIFVDQISKGNLYEQYEMFAHMHHFFPFSFLFFVYCMFLFKAIHVLWPFLHSRTLFPIGSLVNKLIHIIS